MSESIRVLVDDAPPSLKSALPLPGFDALGHRVVEVSGKILRSTVDEALQNVMSLLSNTSCETATHRVSEVSFTLAFNAAGEVSIVSLAKGALTGSTGLTFTIQRKPD